MELSLLFARPQILLMVALTLVSLAAGVAIVMTSGALDEGDDYGNWTNSLAALDLTNPADWVYLIFKEYKQLQYLMTNFV